MVHVSSNKLVSWNFAYKKNNIGYVGSII